MARTHVLRVGRFRKRLLVPVLGVAALLSAVSLGAPAGARSGGAAEPSAEPGVRAQAPTKIMPLGDSITYGSGSSHGAGYRKDLWDQLTGAGHEIDFVGSQQDGDVPDADHEGHSGWQIEDIDAEVVGWLEQTQPNVVLLHIGTNDLNVGNDVANAPQRLGALIDKVVEIAPDATMLVSSLVPALPDHVQGRIDAYNAAVPDVVQERADAGKDVHFVDTASTMTPEDLADDLHPNDQGYSKMATSWYDALAPLLPPVSGNEPSGEPMPVGDLPGWEQVFRENFKRPVPVGEFPGTVYGDKWDVYPDGWNDTSGNGTYYPSKVVNVANGVLNKHLHTEDGVHMVAALLPNLRNVDNGQTYGRYSVRFESDPVPLYKTAWLLWPDSEQWPDDGEIDFPEGNLDSTIHAFMHYANPAGGQDQFDTDATYTEWHTATVEWTPGKVVFILDGEEIGTSTTQVPSNPMHQVIQTETCLGDCGPPDDAAEGNVQIDWVVAYAMK